jgi:hypothetical protein
VTFTDNGVAIPGCSAVAPARNGPTRCTVTVAKGAGPTEYRTANYSGDTVYNGASATITKTVKRDVKPGRSDQAAERFAPTSEIPREFGPAGGPPRSAPLPLRGRQLGTPRAWSSASWAWTSLKNRRWM